MIRAYIAAFVSGLLSVIGLLLYRNGKKDANHANETQDHNEYVETTKRINGVDRSGNDDEWLHERAKRGRNL